MWEELYWKHFATRGWNIYETKRSNLGKLKNILIIYYLNYIPSQVYLINKYIFKQITEYLLFI